MRGDRGRGCLQADRWIICIFRFRVLGVGGGGWYRGVRRNGGTDFVRFIFRGWKAISLVLGFIIGG
jgi:hypothetical protein